MALRLVRCMCFFVVIVFVVVPWFLWLSDSLLGSRGFSGFLVLTRTVPWLSGFNFVVLWSFWFSWFVIPFSYSLLVSCFSSSLFLLVLWMSCFYGCCVLVPPLDLVLLFSYVVLWFLYFAGCRGSRGSLDVVILWLSWVLVVVDLWFSWFPGYHDFLVL